MSFIDLYNCRIKKTPSCANKWHRKLPRCAIRCYQPSRHPLAGSYLTQTQCSFETRDALFLGYSQSFQLAHFTTNCTCLLSFIVRAIAQSFFKLCEMPDDYYSSQVAFYFLRQSRIQLSLTSYVLPAAWFPMFSASSVILSFSFAMNEQ